MAFKAHHYGSKMGASDLQRYRDGFFGYQRVIHSTTRTW